METAEEAVVIDGAGPSDGETVRSSLCFLREASKSSTVPVYLRLSSCAAAERSRLRQLAGRGGWLSWLSGSPTGTPEDGKDELELKLAFFASHSSRATWVTSYCY